MAQISYTTLPSSIVYSINVPEVKNFDAKFVYNFFVVDEVINDSGQVSKDVAEVSRIMVKSQANGSLDYINLNNTPRYVKISFSVPTQGVTIGSFESLNNDQRKELLSSIVYEEDFASDSFTTINIDNKTIQKQTSVKFDKNLEKTIEKLNSTFDNTTSNDGGLMDALLIATSQQAQNKGSIFSNSLISKRFDDLKKVKFTGQISNNVVYDLFLFSSGSYGTNNAFFASNLDFAKSQSEINKNLKFSISDHEFKPSIKTYANGSEAGSVTNNNGIATSNLKKELIGYLIEKIELLSDGTTRKCDDIVLSRGSTTSYIDYKVRYGAVYAYQIRALYKIKYPATDSETLSFKLIESIISSRAEMAYVETIEDIAPPPPVELNFVWDYDRFNPLTATYDYESGKPFPDTGTRGSLLLTWSFPNNRQLDIKKFQIFRRKTIDEPFELLKMIDFDDSVELALNKFFSKEDSIDSKLVKRSVINRQGGLPAISVPIKIYYDDEFLKSSEYIYSIACVDAHGLSSNYSEQFKVSFDSYKNKITKKLVSIAGAPKPYPNMHLQQDLFVDTIKISNKKNLYVYLNPECYFVKNGDKEMKILSSGKVGSEYTINFANTDAALGANLSINIDANNV